MIHISNPRKQKEWRMFTKSGKPVYSYGRSHTTEKAKGRLPIRAYERLSPYYEAALERASETLGEPCEWRYEGETEVMDIYF